MDFVASRFHARFFLNFMCLKIFVTENISKLLNFCCLDSRLKLLDAWAIMTDDKKPFKGDVSGSGSTRLC
jgi:hypothetical protein